MALARPYAATPTDTILHLIREHLIEHQRVGVASSAEIERARLDALADLTEELDQRLTVGGALPSQWRHHR